jgi:hypothetical protein
MTRFTAVWSPNIIAALADIWLNSSDRAAVTLAAAEIERLLRDDPMLHGVPVKEGLWGLSKPPLRVLFTINEADRLVEVVLVKAVKELGNG